MSIVDEVKIKAENDRNAQRALQVLGMNRHMRRKIARVNRTAKIPGVTMPYLKPHIDSNH